MSLLQTLVQNASKSFKNDQETTTLKAAYLLPNQTDSSGIAILQNPAEGSHNP
jgi:hypothetical protein